MSAGCQRKTTSGRTWHSSRNVAELGSTTISSRCTDRNHKIPIRSPFLFGEVNTSAGWGCMASTHPWRKRFFCPPGWACRWQCRGTRGQARGNTLPRPYYGCEVEMLTRQAPGQRADGGCETGEPRGLGGGGQVFQKAEGRCAQTPQTQDWPLSYLISSIFANN